MRIKTNRTARQWAAIEGAEDGEAASNGAAEAARHLSQAVRSANLVVLSGLGTSLCVRHGGDTLAPTMSQLLVKVRDEFARLDAVDPLPDGRRRWAAFTMAANVAEDEGNFEYVLSRAKLAGELTPEPGRAILEGLLRIAERVIRKAVDFLTPETTLLTHGSFLRRIARRLVCPLRSGPP